MLFSPESGCKPEGREESEREELPILIETEKQAMTYSPAKRIAVPSALKGLTSGFGMGPGGPLRNDHLYLYETVYD